MNRRPSWLWRSAVVVAALGLGACNAGDLEPGEQESLGTGEASLCTCGTTQYNTVQDGEGATCGAALTQARSHLNAYMASRCSSGSCNLTQSVRCVPIGPSRDDGFRYSITATFSCNEPVGCG
ncbi:hypothetical protein JY651_36925 [Pyxidicoccus parkwayensis]|uniref:Lipoprotein n=1 Tax=Pyxidicoccus parkwayensis TaxID=2813578 RepID=A0ABX7NPJ3_9BACT|nr:hypothetical protein [Pyxidicoccus parkwaysis]QSQ20774.1 hypothetical protein JY651_36925 [Pyxidicoccus parkwaysis]